MSASDTEHEVVKETVRHSTSIHFTQEQLLKQALEEEERNRQSLQELLEIQRSEALKRKQGFTKRTGKIVGAKYIKFKSRICEEILDQTQSTSPTKKSTTRKSINSKSPADATESQSETPFLPLHLTNDANNPLILNTVTYYTHES